VAPNRKRHAIDAARERWLLLGELLQGRRQELGYRHRPEFARGRLPPTEQGNPNTRLVADVEMGYRDTFPPGTLRELARAYGVNYESAIAVLRGEADGLIPAKPALPPAPTTPGSDGRKASPANGEDNAAASWPYAEAIWELLYDLAVDGNSDPTGADLFGHGTDDARTWDDPRLRRLLPLRERVWNIADLCRREAGKLGLGTALTWDNRHSERSLLCARTAADRPDRRRHLGPRPGTGEGRRRISWRPHARRCPPLRRRPAD
jgi:hypothetical protein